MGSKKWIDKNKIEVYCLRCVYLSVYVCLSLTTCYTWCDNVIVDCCRFKIIGVKINSAICLFKSNDDAKSLMILMNSDNAHVDGMISRDLTNANHSIII